MPLRLLDKFIDVRMTFEKEMTARHGFEMLLQDLNAQIDQATQDKDEKALTKALKFQAEAEADDPFKKVRRILKDLIVRF